LAAKLVPIRGDPPTRPQLNPLRVYGISHDFGLIAVISRISDSLDSLPDDRASSSDRLVFRSDISELTNDHGHAHGVFSS